MNVTCVPKVCNFCMLYKYCHFLIVGKLLIMFLGSSVL